MLRTIMLIKNDREELDISKILGHKKILYHHEKIENQKMFQILPRNNIKYSLNDELNLLLITNTGILKMMVSMWMLSMELLYFHLRISLTREQDDRVLLDL